MPSIQDDALSILKYLNKNKATITNSRLEGELRKALKMSETDYDSAHHFLYQQKYVEGAGSGDNASIWITSSGIERAEEAVKEQNFLRRKKDEIIIAVITGLISFAGGIATGVLLSRLVGCP